MTILNAAHLHKRLATTPQWKIYVQQLLKAHEEFSHTCNQAAVNIIVSFFKSHTSCQAIFWQFYVALFLYVSWNQWGYLVLYFPVIVTHYWKPKVATALAHIPQSKQSLSSTVGCRLNAFTQFYKVSLNLLHYFWHLTNLDFKPHRITFFF